VDLKVLGDGPLESDLKSLIKSLNLDTRVELTGHISQSDLPEYLEKASIFVRPSLSEGQGISFIEAMAAGLPVVATRVGGIPDFLRKMERLVYFAKSMIPKTLQRR
jgi:1,2-diacylglycerol 3-alpha-glucosyltransferase